MGIRSCSQCGTVIHSWGEGSVRCVCGFLYEFQKEAPVAKTNVEHKTVFRMRNDLVLIRKQKRGLIRGLHMPEASAEGVEFFVEGVGPEVVGLAAGDQVMMMGKGTDQFYPVPGRPDLLVCEQKLVAYAIDRVDVKEGEGGK